jgi:hypothetical protein
VAGITAAVVAAAAAIAAGDWRSTAFAIRITKIRKKD